MHFFLHLLLESAFIYSEEYNLDALGIYPRQNLQCVRHTKRRIFYLDVPSATTPEFSIPAYLTSKPAMPVAQDDEA